MAWMISRFCRAIVGCRYAHCARRTAARVTALAGRDDGPHARFVDRVVQRVEQVREAVLLTHPVGDVAAACRSDAVGILHLGEAERAVELQATRGANEIPESRVPASRPV